MIIPKSAVRAHVDLDAAYVCELQAVEGCADVARYSTSPTVPFECSTHRLPMVTPLAGAR